jgi:hypothetical protein
MSENQVTIHVRFSPDGTVNHIDERPSGATPQTWFNRLSQLASNGYQALAGGRGLYRLPKADVDALRSSFAELYSG